MRLDNKAAAESIKIEIHEFEEVEKFKIFGNHIDKTEDRKHEIL